MLPGLGVQALVPVAGELALERQQLIEATARVGIDREGAVVEFRAILGDLALGRLLIRAGPLQIVGHIAQRRAPQIGVREVGIELDRARVVADRGLVVAQLSVERGPVIINQHVVRRVERYPVVVVERPIIVADLRAQDRPVEIGQRIGRVERDSPRKVLDRLHRTLRARVDHSPVEIGGNISRIVADRLVEIGQSQVVLLLRHVERTPAVVARRIEIIRPDRRIVVLQSAGRVFQIKVARTPVDIGVRDLVVITDKRIEIFDRLLELLAQQVGDAPAVIGPRQIGTQVDRFLKIAQRVVVIAHAHPRDGPVLERGGENGILPDRFAEILIGADQIVEVVLRNAPQEIALVGGRVGPQQDVEHLDGVPVLAFDQETPPCVEKISLVELSLRAIPRQPSRQHEQEQEDFTHARHGLGC